MPRIADAAINLLTSLEPFPQPPVIPVQHPVVLMHGFGILAAFRRKGHLHEEAMNLRLHGVRAYAPNVVAYNTVPIRAAMWKDRLERILDETGAERVNLIAHSMGGLDARYLISELEMHPHIASLVTISTPHHGSPIAALLREQPERLQSWVTDLCNWMGTTVQKEAPSDFLTTVAELTEEYVCERFNPAIPDHPSVQYWSFAGAAGKGAEAPINPFLLLFNSIIHKIEGINDGFVSVESAKWGEFKGTIEADHARQVGIQLAPGGTFKSNDFYSSVAAMLAAEGL